MPRISPRRGAAISTIGVKRPVSAGVLGFAGFSVPTWQPLIHGLILLGLFLCTVVSSELRPMWRFSFIIVIIFFLGYGGGWDWGLIPFIRDSTFWTDWISTGPVGITDLTVHLLRLTPGLTVLLFLLASGRHRGDFFRIVALTYRRILVDHARKRCAHLLGEEKKLLIDAKTHSPILSQVDILTLDEALRELETLDQRQAIVAELRLFRGLTPTEIADMATDLSIDQVKYAWKIGSLWLTNRLMDRGAT